MRHSYHFDETVGSDLMRRLCDCAWHVRFKDGRSVVFLFEFQASVDPDMAQRWYAATTVPEQASRRQRAPAVARAVAGMEVRHGYRVLDLQWALAQDLLPEDSLTHWLAALERDPWPNFPRVHRAMAEQWGGADCLAARQAFAAWTVERMRAAEVPDEVLGEIEERIEQPMEAVEMGQTYAEWAESHRQRGMERGMAQAMGAEQLARVGDAVVDCDTGEELLAAASNGATKGD